MQQFWTLLNKELRGYFRSYLAYFLFFIYMFSSMAVAFYFGSYLAMHDVGLYALFYAQPIILVLIIPAITMKTWSEEYKSGTAEFLLTQPVSLAKIVLAKSLASFIISIIMSLSLLPMIIYSSSWLALDIGNIVLDFVGLWLLMGLFCTVGCLISAFNKSIIISYLMSMFVMALWVSLSYTFLYEVFNNYLFAEIGISDILYFGLFILCAVAINIMTICYKQLGQQFGKVKFWIMIALLFLGTIVFNVVAYNLFNNKFDLSYSDFYSLKTTTTEMLDTVQKPLTIDVYVAKDYINSNSDYYHYYQQVLRFVKKYQTYTKGMISVNSMVLDPYSEMEENALKDGLYFEENNKGSRNYFGAIIRDMDGNKVVINNFILERFVYLENDIDAGILKIVNPQMVKNVGVYLDASQKIDDFEGVLIDLENNYNVINVTRQVYEISPKIDLFIMINPKNIGNFLMYALDQYIMQGGKVIIFFDFFTEGQSEIVNSENIKILDYFYKWGIKPVDKMVDGGRLNKDFGKTFFSLKLASATVFNLKPDVLDVKLKPFIISDDGVIGGIVEGKVQSVYKANPFINTEIAGNMKPFLAEAKDVVKVAFVGDADILRDENWIANNSLDKNPYSIVEKTANGRAFKYLVDYMADNSIYQQMPINDVFRNKKSIGQQIQQIVYENVEQPYLALKNKIIEQKLSLYKQSNNDSNFQKLLDVSEAGRNIAKQEKMLREMDYDMKNKYQAKVQKIMLINMLIIPVLWGLLLGLAMFFYEKRKKIKIQEMFNE